METFKHGSKYAQKYSYDNVFNWSVSKESDQMKMQNSILADSFENVDALHNSELQRDHLYVLIGVVFYNSGTNSFISVPEIYCGYMVMELVAMDEVKRIHVGADKIAKEQGL